MITRVFKSRITKLKSTVAFARQFSRDEDGGVFTIFVVLGFIVILGTAGIGVDIMNFERDRADLQATLDRAVLAAANVKQTLPPKDVVKAYIEKSGVRGDLTKEPIVVEDIGSRKVTANAEVEVRTHFMRFFGTDSLTANVTSVAEESVGSIEISLVLDMSGSMSWPSATENKSKMAALQEAAIQFVNTMYEKENPDKISISIVPYNNQVSAGANILNQMSGVTTEHSYSHCVDFRDSQFREPGVNPSASLNRTAHFDNRNYGDDYADEFHRTSVCPTRAGSDITPVTNVISDLHDQINAMSPGGNTSIDIGVKWGAALLDPQFQSVIDQLSRQNANPNEVIDPDTGNVAGTDQKPKKVVPAIFDNRPVAYEGNVKKIMIVMTDGENTENWILDESLRDGLSDVWFNPNAGQHTRRECVRRRWWGCERFGDITRSGEFSVLVAENPREFYYTRRNTRGHAEPFGGEFADQSVRLTYPQLWNMVSLDWNAAYNMSQEPNNNTNWYSNAFSTTSRTDKDTRLQQTCTAIKGRDVEVYGIAFEAPDVGVTAMRNCSSGAGFFFEVNANGNLGEDNLSLTQVFEVIATNIKRLRLTQ